MPSFRVLLARLLLAFVPVAISAQLPVPLDPRETSCAPGASPLMILGTYHMANPGQDARNLTADDPRSPQRQQELAELLGKLHAFRPTKVAVEGVYGRSVWIARYRDYLKGTYTLGTNEIEQIGFQLARRSGLAEISPADYPMWMDGRVPDEIDYDWKSTAPAARPSASTEAAPPSEEETRLAQSTITEYLVHVNGSEYMRKDHHSYSTFLRPSTSSNAPFANTDALTNWYKRNFRIFTNLYRVSTPGTDRVFLLIGAGHLSILRQLAIESDDFCLVDTEAVLKR